MITRKACFSLSHALSLTNTLTACQTGHWHTDTHMLWQQAGLLSLHGLDTRQRHNSVISCLLICDGSDGSAFTVKWLFWKQLDALT